MQIPDSEGQRYTPRLSLSFSGLAAVTAASILLPASHALAADPATNAVSNSTSDPVLGLMLEKGMIT